MTSPVPESGLAESLAASLRQARIHLDGSAIGADIDGRLEPYLALLEAYARRGDVEVLLRECSVWRGWSGHPALGARFQEVQGRLQQALVQPDLARRLGVYLRGRRVDDIAEFRDFLSFVLFLGPGMVPVLLEELRGVSDRTLRHKLAYLLASLCRLLGTAVVRAALRDPDPRHAEAALGILQEAGGSESFDDIRALTTHADKRLRLAALRAMCRMGGPGAAAAISEFITSGPDAGELGQAIAFLAAMEAPGLERALIAAYARAPDNAIRVAVARALARFPSAESVRFLGEISRRSWYEILTGGKRELRLAALQSLAAIRRRQARRG